MSDLDEIYRNLNRFVESQNEFNRLVQEDSQEKGKSLSRLISLVEILSAEVVQLKAQIEKLRQGDR